MSDQKELVISSGDQLLQPTTRRKFLGVMGMGGAIVFLPSVFAACNDSNDGTGVVGGGTAAQFTLNLSDDTGILNYAYALEQLEAAYYTAALGSPGFAALSANDQEVLSDLQKHEVIHREFFKTVLGAAALPTIVFNTTTVGALTANKDVLLKTSQLLEDTGVSAYNGAGKYLKSTANLLVAGKIVSVEARHAAAIRDMRDSTGRLFAGDDVVDKTSGLDVKAEPGAVLTGVAGLNVLVSPVSLGTGPDASKKTADAPAPNPV